jgi:membrane protein
MPRLPDLKDLHQRMRDDEVLYSASAMSFQILTALIPLVLLGLAVAGFVHLSELWNEAADKLRPNLSPASFIVVDDTVRQVLSEQQPLWLTLGAALAIWRTSASMRAVMTALDKLYRCEERSIEGRLLVSIALALAVTMLLLLALAVVLVSQRVLDADGALGVLSAIVRWVLAATLLLSAVGIVLHFAPSKPQSLRWVTFGSLVSVGSWLLASVAFGFYVRNVASYDSLFGSFASIFVLLTYLYVASTAFLVGVLIDAEVQDETTDSRE